MRTYECVLLPEEADEFHHSQHNEKKGWGKNQRSSFGIGVDLWNAEELMQ